jgi:hypothetical protein
MQQPLFMTSVFMWCAYSAVAQIDAGSLNAQGENPFQQMTPTTLERSDKPPVSLAIPLKDRDKKMMMPEPKQEDPLLDMTAQDGLIDHVPGQAPRGFEKDKEPTTEFARDQFLGDLKTGGDFVSVKYRDHEYVDGDLIRVYVNGDVVQSQVFLGGSFSGFTLRLEQGFNRIEFEALNQGSSGPNTAELHIYDDNGFIVSAKEWNLLTGYRASVIVQKE